MTQSGSEKKRERLRGVSERPEHHGERRFRARISRGRGRQVNLGLYPTRWLAAFAYNVAAEALHDGRRAANEIPRAEQPTAEQVQAIAARVRRRLGLDEPPPPPDDRPPGTDDLLTLLEITVVGFWRGQVVAHVADQGRELDLAARRLVDAARLLFWNHSAGHPTPLEALTRLLGLRLDRVFRRSDLTREVLDDDGDDPLRVARWLVEPDERPGGGGFRAAIEYLYADLLGPDGDRAAPGSIAPDWAAVLGIAPPFGSEQVRSAYRRLSKTAHPDVGGDPDQFVRLQAAYDEARRYCLARGL